jgi:lipoprotein-anchoring transpeptidase ErfK/SrfK
VGTHRWAGARRRLVGACAAIFALGLVAGCGSGQGARWQAGPPSPTPGASNMVITPAADAKDISPVDPVKVEVAFGHLDAVTLTNPQGKVVKGDFSADKSTWTNGEVLGYNKTYKISASGTGDDGEHHEQTLSFTTVKPKNLTLPYLRANLFTLLDKKTYGVGQPIVVWFDEPITDKAAAQRALTVTTDPPVEGAWHWFDNRELHWRPQSYWTPGTKVTVEANVYGRNLGNGLYGQEDVSASFSIAPHARMLVVDAATQRMKIYVDGHQLTTLAGKDISNGFPIATGKSEQENGVDFRTYSGVHVMMEKHDVKEMRSCNPDGTGICDPTSPNYYVSDIKLAIRISNSGEFVHLRDWYVSYMGTQYHRSHGCVNVGVPYINWIWENFGSGDIVNVLNTGKTLNVRDGLGDWIMPWDQWVKGGAL